MGETSRPVRRRDDSGEHSVRRDANGEFMKTMWKVGDTAAGRCPRCKALVRSRFELRTVQLTRSRLSVPDLLVAVCTQCDHTMSIPPQSLPQLREAGAAK
jgi:hypothetical protein